MSVMQGEVLQLLEREIPDGRRHLQDSHNNLEKVAAYCEGNYIQAADRRHALEETKNYTTQSLASVAYQINTLANNFIMLLDLQLNQLADMESSINHLSQTVMIHKEKVARREIGVLTTNKATARPAGVKNPGIIFPDQQEKPVKYTRKPIDYSVLDDTGHGVKSQQQNPRSRRTSTGSTKSGAGQAPTTKPPTPPSGTYRMAGAGGSLTRQASSPYRTPAPPISPPSVPSNYAPSYPGIHHGQPPAPIQIQAGAAERRSGYAAVSNMAQAPPATPPPPPPPMGMVQPMAHPMPHSMAGVMAQSGPPPTPPPPPMMPQVATTRQSFTDPLPPPLPESAYQMPVGNVSPPLPPPPDQDHGYGGHFGGSHFGAPPPTMFSSGPHDVDYGMGRFGGPLQPTGREEEQSSAPESYIEKVLAIYDYAKDKDDELSFTEGALIYVIRKNDDGWWEGMLDGCTGLFPGNYVEPCI